MIEAPSVENEPTPGASPGNVTYDACLAPGLLGAIQTQEMLVTQDLPYLIRRAMSP